MAKKSESKLQQRIQKALKAEFGRSMWIVKIHGGPFQKAGIPDLIGCVHGLFFGLEVKMPDGKLSRIQDFTLSDILKAGGIAAEVTTPEQAVRILTFAVEQAGRVSAKRRAVLVASTPRSAVLRAGNGKDVHRRRRARATD
jgi:hypothetical protein